MQATRFDPKRLSTARAGMSFEAIASAVGVTAQTIRNWEAGKSEPDASNLGTIAAVTGKALDFFFVEVTDV